MGSDSDLTGRVLGDFVVRERIGQGGFGAVHLALQQTLAREAVVKVFRSRSGAAHEELTRRFLREARLASQLDHPYAAHIYAFGAEPDGVLWIAMELVRGTSLDKLLRVHGPLSVERLVPLLDRICEVVHTAHEQGIIHRDIKPANVMVLSRAGRLLPKLIDFGIAKALNPSPPSLRGLAIGAKASAPPPDGDAETAPGPGDATRSLPDTINARLDQLLRSGTAGATRGQRPSSGIVGTPAYMAPEQWEAGLVDERSDVYSLGVLAYEALTGHLPFDGLTLFELAQSHRSWPLPPDEKLPPPLFAVLQRALAKRPADRFPDALALAAAFHADAGLAQEPGALPRLDDWVAEAMLSDGPQPIAEAIAALNGARNLHQVQGAMWQVFGVAVRYVGLLALACRTRIGASAEGDPPPVTAALRDLRRHGLRDGEWVALARDLVRPFAARSDAHPIPELVSLLLPDGTAGDPFAPLLALRAPEERDEGAAEDRVRSLLGRALPPLGELLRALLFLTRYPLVVPRGGHAERWMGVRRPLRTAIAVRGKVLASLPEGEPAVLDRDGCPVVSLAPLIQAAPPSPGAPPELFLLECDGRTGARLVAPPSGFARSDPALWEWFGAHLLQDAGDHPSGDEEDRAPYLGLAAFTAADARLFIGREREVEAFVNRLRVQPLVAVVGPSGAGKSSFVGAGAIPALPADWRSITTRPGSAPLATLAARLAKAGIACGDFASDPRAALTRDPDALGSALRAAATAKGGAIVLVVDQFEELFTLCPDVEERHLFADALARAARSQDDPVRVVLTLRDDFLLRAGQLPALRDRLTQGLQLLATPAEGELRRILVEPARRAGYEFEDPELPAEMVSAVADQPGALALVSFTASKLWELRDRHFRRLPWKVYRAMGGVGGALAQHAEATLAGMPSDQQAIVRYLFRRLVTAEGTRAVLTRAELDQVLVQVPGQARAGGLAQAVVETLIGARLLVAFEGETGEERAEVVHEALLAAWSRLVTWLREDAH
ncbi:MAG: serine/threonine-protein kinase PknK, partial [Myxococcales bacterium]|nr:serine/threonine-protein kinase PknK [Myxococcales bacterium]